MTDGAAWNLDLEGPEPLSGKGLAELACRAGEPPTAALEHGFLPWLGWLRSAKNRHPLGDRAFCRTVISKILVGGAIDR